MQPKETFEQKVSLKKRILLLFLLTAVLVPIIAGALNIYQFSHTISDNVSSELENNNLNLSEYLSRTLHERVAHINNLAKQDFIIEAVAKEKDLKVTQRMNSFVNGFPLYSTIMVFDRFGKLKNTNNLNGKGIFINNDKMIGQNQRSWQWDISRFKEKKYINWFNQCINAKPNKPFISNIVRKNLTFEKNGIDPYNILFAAPIKLGYYTAGCVLLGFKLSELKPIYKKTLTRMRKKLPSFELNIVDENGLVMWESFQNNKNSFISNVLNLEVVSFVNWKKSNYADILIEETHMRSKKKVITSVLKVKNYLSFPGLNWAVLSRIEKAEITNPIIKSLIGPVITILIMSGLLIAVIIIAIRKFSITIDRSLNSIQKIGEGDYSEEIEVESQDEVGKLQFYLRNTISSLRNIAREVINTRKSANEMSVQSSQKVKEILNSSQEQSALLEEASAAMEELSASTSGIQDAAQKQLDGANTNAKAMMNLKETFIKSEEIQDQITEGASRVSNKAGEGGTSIQNSVKSMEEISETSQKILGIIDVINDIADQTDLLALNASIEAARAGEHGKGFAVVAHEISELAEKSSQSSKEIARLLRAANEKVETGTEQVVGTREIFYDIIESMKTLVSNISKVSELDKHIREEVNETARRAQNVSGLAKEIAEATHLQNQSAEEITDDMSKANSITATNADQISSLSEMLRELAEVHEKGLDLVAQLKLPELQSNSTNDQEKNYEKS